MYVIYSPLANFFSQKVAFLFMEDAVTVFEEKEGGVQLLTRRSAVAKIAGGVITVLVANVLKNNAEANVDRDQRKDFVDTVEFNTFGDQPRTSIIYRDADGSIVDWRWYADPKQIPQPLDDGRHMAIWEDQGSLRTILCWHVRFTRTKEDRELAERAILPEHRRRKLSK